MMIDTIENIRQRNNNSRTSTTPASTSLRMNPFGAIKNDDNNHNNEPISNKPAVARDSSTMLILHEDDVDIVPDLAKTSMFGGL